MNYMISRAGQQYGPYSFADLRRYVSSGNILVTDLTRNDEMAEWIPVSQLLGATAAGQQTAVPPPPGYAQAPVYVQTQPVLYAQPVSPNYPPPKSRVAFILLGVFLGHLGVHNFYAGYTGRGLAQLLITLLTCGLGAIVTFVWSIIEVCTVDKDSQNVYFN